MSFLILVRHGQSIWNMENKFTGWVDVELTEKGKSEAEKAGISLSTLSIEAIYTSPLQRASDTAKEIAKSQVENLNPILEINNKIEDINTDVS